MQTVARGPLIEELRLAVKNAPDAPGVYMMKDAQGVILYVGKAKSLRRRLTSYLSRTLPAKTRVMMQRCVRIVYTLCRTESLALLTEASLIRAHQPKYNTALRDDKSYPLVRISGEAYPCVSITRARGADGAKYYGPYTSAELLREALKIIRKAFPYRSCSVLPRKACLYRSLRLCPGFCVQGDSSAEYAKTLLQIGLILEGKADLLIRDLSQEMACLAAARKFEEAASVRDKIRALSSLSPVCADPQSAVRELGEMLGLGSAPQRIETFDVSNLHGKEAVASMVSFSCGLPDKANYRRFRIRTVAGIDDFSMIKEAVYRRYRRLREEAHPFPDLVVIDGGRGHLHAAAAALRELGVCIPLASIAKEREHIYTIGRAVPLRLHRDTPALNLLRAVRDEAHRFALSYHRLLRRRKLLSR
jgi:excinuclease ABC subunit C